MLKNEKREFDEIKIKQAVFQSFLVYVAVCLTVNINRLLILKMLIFTTHQTHVRNMKMFLGYRQIFLYNCKVY